MAPKMTALTKIIILNIHFALFCLMKLDGVNRLFSFAKRDISEWCSRYEAKNNLPGVLNKVCRQRSCLSST